MTITTYRKGNQNITIGAKFPIKEWTVGVPVEDEAKKQLFNVAQLPFIFKHVAAMPDCHAGIGATIGSVIPTQNAVIPAAVGVDLGCGLGALKTTLKASQLPDSLAEIRSAVEKAVPHGRTDNGKINDKGGWGSKGPPDVVNIAWMGLQPGYKKLVEKHKKLTTLTPPENHLGTLGSGNHFIEICLDESDNIWIMLHSGSRGVGNRIGTYFISLAKEEMKRWYIDLPDDNLAFLPEGSLYFDDYIKGVSWAQNYALINRELMMNAVVKTLKNCRKIPKFETVGDMINCHHNYVARENHFGKNIWVTRKGAIRAREGEVGIIPGSMGAKSFIVEGLGNEDSFKSASHGAGRKMSRTKAKKTFSLDEHKEATKGIKCRKDSDIIDETPGAYKDIQDVMNAQSDLVEITHTLKQIICIKG